jgi:hypothetical protein
MSKAYQELGNTSKAAKFTDKYLDLTQNLFGYFDTNSEGALYAPYAVHADGSGAYNEPTGHDVLTPNCEGDDCQAYSLSGAYLSFAAKGIDPLRYGSKVIANATFVADALAGKRAGGPVATAVLDQHSVDEQMFGAEGFWKMIDQKNQEISTYTPHRIEPISLAVQERSS